MNYGDIKSVLTMHSINRKKMNMFPINSDKDNGLASPVRDQQVTHPVIAAWSEVPENKAMMTIKQPDTDRDVFLSRKEQSGKQSERDNDYQNTKNKMKEILSKMTEQDYWSLEEEGFAVEDFTISGLDSALGRIKSIRSKEENTESNSGAERDYTGRSEPFTVQDIKERLKESNLPVTEEAARKVLTAIKLSQSINNLKDGAIRNLLSRELSPTIANIYKAQYSSHIPESTTTLSNQAWEELLPQVKEIISDSGYEINDESLGRARWLIENNISLTEKNFKYYSRLKDMVLPDQNAVLEQILVDMGEGISPEDAILLPYDKASLEGLIKALQSLGENEIREALKEESQLTLKELIHRKAKERLSKEASKQEFIRAQELTKKQELMKEQELTKKQELMKEQELTKKQELMKEQELTKEQQLEAIRAQRQLEEIRLKMTLDAAARLERRGFHIETKQLEEVVEELRKMEEAYYRKLLAEADLEADIEQINILKDTTESMEKLKVTPSFILGTTLSIRKQMTVPTLLEEGNRLRAELNKANAAYETLMTQPNREYGDSLQKAFNNSVSMLEEMGLESTVYNRRALRILGYNRMEITKESMEQVKAYDMQVNTLIKNLHPSVTVRLIKEGINPMELPIGELDHLINEIRDKQGITSEERFSTYLRRLEKEEGISKAERKAYIGIYRLLHNIEKTDGAALGAVIKADQEITLSHLLTAVRSLQKGSMDTVVDDQFGALQSISFDKESIAQQLKPVFGESADSGSGAGNQQDLALYQEAKLEFTNSIIKQLLSEVAPERLSYMKQNIIGSEHINGQSQAGVTPLLSSDRGIWEAIKDIPLDTLYDRIVSTDSPEAYEDPIYSAKLQELRQIFKNSDQAIRFLEDCKVPCTTTNVLLAGQILYNDSSFFRKYRKLLNESTEEKSKNNLQEMERIADTLIDKESMNEAYGQLENEVRSVIEEEIQSDRIDSFRLAELKSLGAHMSLMKTLAGREFYQIPVETKDGITTINLTVVRGTGKTGKVTVTLQSEHLGRIKADLSLKRKELNGYIACDNRRGCELLKESQQDLNVILAAEKINVKQLEVCFSQIGNEMNAYQHPPVEEKPVRENPEMERQLYRIAKSLVIMVRAAETAGDI